MNVDPDGLLQLVQDLIAIPSVNPGIDGLGEGEGAVGDFLFAYAQEHGFDVTTQQVAPGRRNVIIDLGVPAHRTLLLVSHLDTVPARDLTPRAQVRAIEHGRLYGRGSCDAKGPLAAMIQALHILRPLKHQLRVNVQVAAMVDEEHTFQGVLAFVDQLPAALQPVAAIVGEPTRLDVVIAHKGVLRFRVRVHGRAAHTSRPEHGINAIDKMLGVVAALEDVAQRTGPPVHPLVGPATFTVSQIRGGVAPNVVPDVCEVIFDRRTLPGERHEHILAGVDAVLEQLRGADPQLEVVRDEPFVADYALDTSDAQDIVQVALKARAAVVGPSAAIGVPYGTDGSKLSEVGHIPTIVLGPGDIAQAHTADEYVEIAELGQAARIYAQCALLL